MSGYLYIIQHGEFPDALKVGTTTRPIEVLRPLNRWIRSDKATYMGAMAWDGTYYKRLDRKVNGDLFRWLRLQVEVAGR